MKKLFAILLLPVLAWGQQFSVTNDCLYLDNHPLGLQANRQFSYMVAGRLNSAALDLTDKFVQWHLFGTSSTSPVMTEACTILDATGGVARVVATPISLVAGGWAKMSAYWSATSNLFIDMAWDDCSVTGTCSGCGSTTVNVSGGVVTNNITLGAQTNLIIVSSSNTVTLAPQTNTINVSSSNTVTVAPSTNNISVSNIVPVEVTVNSPVTANSSNTFIQTFNITQPSGVTSLMTMTGNIGIVMQPGWNASVSNSSTNIFITTGLPQGTTNVVQLATWDGTVGGASWQALGAPGSTPNVGTNYDNTMTNLWPATNTFVQGVGVSQVLWRLTGAAGGGFSSGAGMIEFITTQPAGTIWKLVNGTSGSTTTNGQPGGGRGINGGTTNGAYGGGGPCLLYLGTNLVGVAGGSGGGGSVNGYGGPGGGFWINTMGGAVATTNVQAGQGGWALNEYGTGATAGTNLALSGASQNGGLLFGGDASTNGCSAGTSGLMGGGAAGYYGGAGSTRTNATAGCGVSGLGVGGGGGLSYANTNFCTFAKAWRGIPGAGGAAVGGDAPGSVAGKGGGANGGAGGSALGVPYW